MIITNGPVITNDPANPFVDNGAVVVQGDSIVAVGPAAEIRAAHPGEEMVDVAGRVIMAGLINAHTHAYSAYARGMAVHQPTRNFTEILENLWWRLDRLLTLEDVELNAATTFIESIRNGVTTVFDHHSSPNAVSGSLQTMADVAGRIGIRTSLCYETSDRDGASVLAAAIEENASFMKRVNTDEQDMVKGLFGLHAAFTLSEESLDAACAAKEGIAGGFHVHVAEGAGDEADSLAKYGKRIVQRFDDHGMLGPETIAAHCVHANPDELDLLKDRDTTVVHNPHSNMGNAVGVASVVDMLARGLRVGLGTDAYTADILASAQVAKIRAERPPRRSDRRVRTGAADGIHQQPEDLREVLPQGPRGSEGRGVRRPDHPGLPSLDAARRRVCGRPHPVRDERLPGQRHHGERGVGDARPRHHHRG